MQDFFKYSHKTANSHCWSPLFPFCVSRCYLCFWKSTLESGVAMFYSPDEVSQLQLNTYCEWELMEHNSKKCHSKFKSLLSIKCIWKYRVRNGGHFVSAAMCQKCILVLHHQRSFSNNNVCIRSQKFRTTRVVTSVTIYLLTLWWTSQHTIPKDRWHVHKPLIMSDIQDTFCCFCGSSWLLARTGRVILTANAIKLRTDWKADS